MPASTRYPGAWQARTYPGAWQVQSSDFTKTLTDSMSIADTPAMSIGKTLTEGRTHDELETYTHDQLEAYTHDELEQGFWIFDSIDFQRRYDAFDSLSLSDVAAFGVGMNVNDSFALSDSPQFEFYKVLSDSLSIIESFIAGNDLILSESFTINDSVVFGVGKGVTDAVALSELFAQVVGKPFGDAVAVSETFVAALTYGRSFGETMAIVDVVTFLAGKNVSDTTSIADAFSRVWSANRFFNDSESLSDVLLVSISKVLSDILSSSESIFKSLSIGQQLSGQKDIAALLADPRSKVRPWMPWVAIGSSNIASNEPYETELWEELHRKRGDVSVTANTYFVRATFGQDEPTSDDLTIYEIGIFDAASDGNMGKRWVLNTGVAKDNVDEIVVECAVTILHGNIQDIQALFILPPGTEPEVGEGVTEQPMDQQPISDRITFELTKRLSLSDVLPMADTISSMDLSKRLADNMSMSDSFASSLPIGGGFPPANPKYNDVLVNAPYAYVLTDTVDLLGLPLLPADIGSGLFIFDVSDVANPTRVSYLELTSPSAAKLYGIFRSPFRLQKVGDIIYASSTHGVFTIDVTDVNNPVQLDYVELTSGSEGASPDIAIQGSIAYTSHYQNGLRLADISDPNNLAAIPLNMDAGALEDWETEFRYRYTGHAPHAENPNGPDPFYSVAGGIGAGWIQGDFIKDVRVSGSYMYMVLRGSLWVTPIAAPYAVPNDPGAVNNVLRPTMICTCVYTDTLFNGPDNDPYAVDVVGTTAYLFQVVPDPVANLRFVEIDTVANTLANSCSITLDPFNSPMRRFSEVLSVGNYVYINSGLGLSIVDKTSFTEIAYISGHRPGGIAVGDEWGFRGMTVYDDHLYICWYDEEIIPAFSSGHEVRIYDLADKANPVQVGECRYDV